MLLQSVVGRGDYDEAEFCRRMDEELFPRLDGTIARNTHLTRTDELIVFQ